jgi:hypothetical protein
MLTSASGTSRLELACEPSATRDAVVHATDVFRTWGLTGDAAADAALIVDELVTNAVRHASIPAEPSEVAPGRPAAPGCCLTLEAHSSHLVICVYDASDQVPVLRDLSLDAESGRGLQLVAGLSEGNWGCTVLRPWPGKLVWARLPTGKLAGPVEQPKPWSTPGKWTITTEGGFAASGYLPEWAEDDPSEAAVPLDLLPTRLAAINHRNFFEGPMMPLATTDNRDDAEEDAVFEGSIDCNPYDPDTRRRLPVVNIQVCLGHHILGLDPQELAEIALKLRAQADRLHDEVLPALIAARQDWTTRQPN